MLNFNKLLQTSICALLVAFFAAPSSGIAAAENFRVRLIATIDNDPAMESVSWTVFRNGDEEVKRAQKHSTQVNIPQGTYTVVARLKSDDGTVIRKRNFLVRKDTLVVVPMDH